MIGADLSGASVRRFNPMTEHVSSFRPVEPSDLDRIEAITIAAWKPIYEGYRTAMGEQLFERRYGDWRTYKVDQVRRQCERSPETVHVAIVDDSVAAYVAFSIDESTEIGEIGNNAVDPNQQGQGIATAMYEHVLDHFRELGMEFATVSTGLADPFIPARRAYESVGFDIERRTVTYWQQL